MSDTTGRFVWHDLMTPDPEAAQAFYTAVIGWGTTTWGGDASYTMWKAGEADDASIGGVMKLPDEAKAMGAPPHWMAYVGVPDVDATVEQATGLGARVFQPPMDIPDVGRFAILADPQGASFAVFSSAHGEMGPEAPASAGQFSWHELATTDWQAARDFYSALFGWEEASSMDMGEMGTYYMYRRPGSDVTLGGIYDKPAAMPAPPSWLHYVHVADLDAAVAAVKELGGQVLNGPMEVPGGDRIAQCMDPQGAAFALHASA